MELNISFLINMELKTTQKLSRSFLHSWTIHDLVCRYGMYVFSFESLELTQLETTHAQAYVFALYVDGASIGLNVDYPAGSRCICFVALSPRLAASATARCHSSDTGRQKRKALDL